LPEDVATGGAQLLVERGGDTVAPVALGCEDDAAATAAGADVTRGRARIVFGGQRELVIALRRGLLRRQEIQREDRRAGS
jgi:hypothetical protein